MACPMDRVEEGRRDDHMRTSFWILCFGMLLAFMASAASGQSVRSLIREGNSHYKDEKFSDAEVSYRKALEKEGLLVQGHFNLGSALGFVQTSLVHGSSSCDADGSKESTAISRKGQDAAHAGSAWRQTSPWPPRPHNCIFQRATDTRPDRLDIPHRGFRDRRARAMRS